MGAPSARGFTRLGVVVAAVALIGVAAVAAVVITGGDPAIEPPAESPPGSPTPEESTPIATGETCPASGMSAMPEEQSGLDEDAAATRRAIVAAAVACDYEQLGSLAGTNGRRFTFSFGDEATAEAFVASLERSGGENLAILVRTLHLPYCEDSIERRVIYQWPSAFCDGATDEDWDALRALYSDEEIAQFREFGSFIGHRVGIDADGTWLFFVAGD